MKNLGNLFIRIIIILLYAVAITFMMALMNPPPKGTAFDGLDYVLKPFFFAVIIAAAFSIISLIIKENQQRFFYIALLLVSLYTILLYIRVI